MSFPECVFLLGADLSQVSEEIRAMDRAKRLGLGGALSLTPPHWVHLGAFSIGRRMVSNGEYLAFLQHVDGEDGGGRIYDGSEIWDEFRQLVRVRNLDRPEPPLLSPPQAFFMRENLKLTVEQRILNLQRFVESIFELRKAVKNARS